LANRPILQILDFRLQIRANFFVGGSTGVSPVGMPQAC
jgi:hypothetical protein